jgi:type I restriction enzyme S subunit
MSFPAYPAYKNSGSDRLGDVPAHWEVVPCRAIVDECVEKNSLGKITEYLSLMANIGIIRYEDKGDIGNKKPDDLSKCKIVKKGDLVINSMNYGIGSYGLSPLDGICSPVYIVLDPRDDVIQERFALRIFEEKEFQAFAQSFGNGILAHRSAIGWDDLKNILVALPSLPEQTLLSNFLDHETAHIDALIEEQQRLIELLKEKRQAVISHAVTKGLDPTVPMKDSGVEWLGEVPAHWVVRKLKNLVSVRGGSTPSKEVELYWEGEIPWVSPKDMKSERISDSIDHVSELAIEDGGLNIVRSGAVLIVVRGMILIHSVPVAITDVDVTINQDMKAMAPGAELSSDYLSLMLQGVRDAVFQYIDSSAHGTRKLEWERFELMDLPIPPHAEQVRVVRFIEEQKHAIDDLAEQAASAIALMNERRSALISAAVTGKIDVRGWQPPASTQAPESAVAEAN